MRLQMSDIQQVPTLYSFRDKKLYVQIHWMGVFIYEKIILLRKKCDNIFSQLPFPDLILWNIYIFQHQQFKIITIKQKLLAFFNYSCWSSNILNYEYCFIQWKAAVTTGIIWRQLYQT